MFPYTYRDNLPKNGSKPLPNNEILFFRPWVTNCTGNVACVMSLCYSMDLVLEKTLYFSTGISSQIIYFWIVKYVVKFFCFVLFCFVVFLCALVNNID